jgi:acetyl-CoA carboxylase biotin carboxyl carrier protein
MSEALVHASNPISPPDWQQLADWLAEADVDCLELAGPGLRLRLVRGAVGYRIEQGSAAVATLAAEPVTVAAAVASCAGVFLGAHPAQGSALARRGDRCRAGDLVGLLQVGLLLVPVTAPTAGVVGDSAVTPGTLVGYGRRLVEILVEGT